MYNIICRAITLSLYHGVRMTRSIHMSSIVPLKQFVLLWDRVTFDENTVKKLNCEDKSLAVENSLHIRVMNAHACTLPVY